MPLSQHFEGAFEMVSKTDRTITETIIPDTDTEPVSNGSRVASDPKLASEQQPAQTANGGETRGEHFRRKAERGRLYGYAILTVALAAFLIALAASNTAQVTVNWVFGSSHLSLVWLVLLAAVLGWLVGLLISARLHWRTRAPRSQRRARS